MNTYDYIKDSITVPQAAERYGMKIGRGGMICCPFHEDKHPSMKLNEQYFYCFGCGAHGDVIDLTARLLGTTTKDTVQTLFYNVTTVCVVQYEMIIFKHPLFREYPFYLTYVK